MPATRKKTAGTSGDRAKLKALATEFVNVFRSNKPTPIERLEEILEEDFTAIDIRETVKGRDAAIEWIRSGLDQMRTFVPTFKEKLDIQVLRQFDNTAVIAGKVAVTGKVAGSQKPFNSSSWLELVCHKTRGVWRIAHEIIIQVG